MMQLSRALVSACLLGLVASLLVVGVASGTLLRHVVQVIPALIAAAMMLRRSDWGLYGAIPIFLFWLFIVVLIWSFLLGFSRIASGHYTGTEVGCTFFMAALSVVGLAACVRLRKTLAALSRLGALVLFGASQVVAMWLSFLKPIANR